MKIAIKSAITFERKKAPTIAHIAFLSPETQTIEQFLRRPHLKATVCELFNYQFISQLAHWPLPIHEKEARGLK